MKNRMPPWLETLHREWQRVRGGKVEPGCLAFGMAWEDLLDKAGLKTAEDRAHAAREAADLAGQGRLELRIPALRKSVIVRVRIPPGQEAWLHSLFQTTSPQQRWQDYQQMVHAMLALNHPVYPAQWTAFCRKLLEDGRGTSLQRLFPWQHPERARNRLDLIRSLSGIAWPGGTPVREASLKLGLDSKGLERQRRAVEAGLSQFLGRPVTLETLGLVTTNSRLLFDGSLVLQFEDGSMDVSGGLRHGDSVTAADLERAVCISTAAHRIVSVENHKTSLPLLAAQNTLRESLLIASSFPTHAVRLLLEKLPPELPHWHFGDTDPAGYLILQRLRRLTPRPVRTLSMDWRPSDASPPLTAWDREVIGKLVQAPGMEDCQDDLRSMLQSGSKGDFEQENRRLPALDQLP